MHRFIKNRVNCSLWAWGKNTTGGYLGLGDTANRSSPVQVGSLTTWTEISGPTKAIKSDGTLWAWGYNGSGELGFGDTVKRSSPTQVGALTTWKAADNNLALKADGTLWASGSNSGGYLGLGDVVSRSSPTQVGSLTTWVSIASSRSFAIKADGTLWVWGANNNGQLGLGDIANRSSPVQLGALTTWVQAESISSSASIALKSDGTLWTWGYNGSGELGLGDIVDRSSPVQVGALSTWALIAKHNRSNNHIHVIKSDGTLWALGSNNKGQLGVGDAANRSSPVQVGSLTDWVSVSDGQRVSVALRSNGTLWTWGYNDSGRLGLGDTADRSSPVQVGSLTSWTAVSAGGGSQIFALRRT